MAGPQRPAAFPEPLGLRKPWSLRSGGIRLYQHLERRPTCLYPVALQLAWRTNALV